jgi:hypothetical protein
MRWQNNFFDFVIAWAQKKFFSEGIDLRALSPNFDICIDYHTLMSSGARRAERLIVFIFFKETRDPYEAKDTLHETL